jgi:CubicO group peptidase (beta-lactamase class C family)
VAGPSLDGLEAFDKVMQEFMHATNVRAGQLTVLKGGWLMWPGRYTFGGPKIKPGSLFRIASCSKALTVAQSDQGRP